MTLNQLWNQIVAIPTQIMFAIIFFLFGLSGCQAWQKPPIEQFAEKFVEGVVKPAVAEGLAQGVENLSMQAGAQGINPTYIVRFQGKWVVGIEGSASIAAEGIAGQIQVTTHSSEKTMTSPHAEGKAEPETPPEEINNENNGLLPSEDH